MSCTVFDSLLLLSVNLWSHKVRWCRYICLDLYKYICKYINVLDDYIAAFFTFNIWLKSVLKKKLAFPSCFHCDWLSAGFASRLEVFVVVADARWFEATVYYLKRQIKLVGNTLRSLQLGITCWIGPHHLWNTSHPLFSPLSTLQYKYTWVFLFWNLNMHLYLFFRSSLSPLFSL